MIKDNDISPSVAAIKTLLEYIKQHSFGTVSELRERVVNAIDTLTKTDSSAISIKSGCEMLLRFITLTALDAGVSWFFNCIILLHINSSSLILAWLGDGEMQSTSPGKWASIFI